MTRGDEREWPWGTDIVETMVFGQPCRSYEPRRKRIAEILADARQFPDRDYIVQGKRRVSFADHESLVRQVTGVLTHLGVQPGDRVLLLGRNSIEWVIAFWAILNAGGVVVLGNAWWSDEELTHALVTSEPSLVLADERYDQSLPRGQRYVALTKLLSEPGQSSVPGIDGGEDEPGVVLFTSGTTGLPKGAVLTHRAIIATLHALLDRTNRLPTKGAPPARPSSALLCLPLFHIGGLQQIITPMVTGGTVVFTEGRFDPGQVVALIDSENIRVWSAVPTMVRRVIDHLAEAGLGPVTSLRTVGMGGSPVGEELRAKAHSWFPNAERGLAVTYGLSEASGVVATGAGPEIASRPGTVGRPLAIADVRIDQPDASGCGEVMVRSPAVMLGYLSREATSTGGLGIDPGPVTSERWLHTGDVGRLDADGFLYITDRSKDIVIRGGENIASSHIEDRLLQHPAVRECAVVGLPHPTLGEEVGAVIVLRAGHEVSSTELGSFAAETLAYFEVPSRWKLQDDPLPQNTTAKVMKRAIRDAWAAELSVNVV